jgi:hypothetical protein
MYIRQLSHIRSTLDTNCATILAKSLVSSCLDYCNLLCHGLPESSINRLQRIQNSLLPTLLCYDHITPALCKLHWLPIRQRTTFKIAMLTFKTLNYSQPSNLLDLITHHTPTRILCSASQHLLVVPRINSETYRRSFSFAALTVWNSLPLSLRSTSSFTTFRASLKTHLFPT